MTTYFISDIHLHANSNAQEQMLFEFLQTQGKDADAIYILGDLFAIWLGDDLNEPYSRRLIKTLQQLSEHVPLYFMPGNRDFLVGKEFLIESGCVLLQDPCKINLYGKEILLTHGDLLCTLDKRYQRFRLVVQNPIFKKIFLMLPIHWRKNMGRWISKKYRGNPQNPATYDVAANTVHAWFSKFNIQTMIHGHTHRPAIHTDHNYIRIVLGDWNPNTAKILRACAEYFELVDLATLG